MSRFIIWVDADSCPLLVRNCILNNSKSKKMNVVFVANHQIPCPEDSEIFKMVICEKKDGAADDYIFENCSDTDIVVTRDIAFAERLVKKQIFVMNDRGTVFTKENIGERMSERNFNLTLASLGLGGSGAKTYGKKELQKFAATFERQTSQLLMNEYAAQIRSAAKEEKPTR